LDSIFHSEVLVWWSVLF